MLRNQQSIRKSKSQSSIRHHVRKLRAKVKALIPSEVCNHFQKRNERIQKINLLRARNQQKLAERDSGNLIWSNSTQKIQSYHVSNEIFENRCKKSHHCQFDKLKPEQMEQINQDKNYYLGEKNVDAYNEYLRKIKSFNNFENYQEFGKKKQRQNIKSKSPRFQRVSNATNSFIWESKSTHINFQKTNFTEQNELLRIKARHSQKKLADNLSKHSQFNEFFSRGRNTVIGNQNLKIGSDLHLVTKDNLQRLKRSGIKLKKTQKKTPQQIKQYLEQQDRQKRMYQKLKIEMQLSKAEVNHRQLTYKKFFKIKQMAKQEKQRHDNAIKKKNLLNKKGEVSKLNQQLRKIIIHQKNTDGKRSNSCVVQSN